MLDASPIGLGVVGRPFSDIIESSAPTPAGADAGMPHCRGFLWMARRIAVDLKGVEAYKRGSFGDPPKVQLFDSVDKRKGCAGGGVEALYGLRILVGIVLVNSEREMSAIARCRDLGWFLASCPEANLRV